MAILLALAFVAAMVLHKHEEPIIIGDLSKEDVSQISRVALRQIRVRLRDAFRIDVRARDVKGLVTDIQYYPSITVTNIEKLPTGVVSVKMRFKSGEISAWCYVKKTDGEWKVGVDGIDIPTNAVPVSQRGVGK